MEQYDKTRHTNTNFGKLMKKKQDALSKARSALKKSEHVKTPKSIKDKLKTKEKKA